MKKQSIFYKYPFFYRNSLRLIHGKNLSKRYQAIAAFIKEGEKVLEPGCGLASVSDFLPPKVSYSGFDLNKSFIKSIPKKKNHSRIFCGNILDYKNYFPVDVIIISDVLHHLKPADKKTFLKNCFRSFKKRMIICEPKGKEELVWGKRFFEYFEQDGINEVDVANFWTKEKLKKEIKNGFGVIPASVPREIQEIGKDIICVFFKEKPLKSGKKANDKKTVSAIIPVYNEEKTIKKVIEAFLNCNGLVSEIICINDGSDDKSLKILKDFGRKIKLINFKKNKGKSFAMYEGVRKSQGEIVLFWDADFPNLSCRHIKKVVEPALAGKYKAVFGVPVKNKMNLSLPTRVYLTGERAYYRKMLLPHLTKIRKTGFGVEIFLNKLVDKKDLKIVNLDGLIFPYKHEKMDPARAFKEYLMETVEIMKEFGKREGILPQDMKIIENLGKVKTLKEFNSLINKIKNKKIKKILKNYILKYLNLAKRKLKL